MNLETAKRRLRERVASRRRGVSAEESAAMAERVRDLLLAEPAFANARRAALYAALDDEIPTRPLFDALVRAGKPALLPRVARGRRLAFSPVERWEDLRPGAFGVLEPPPQAPVVEPAAGDVVIVPGVAFDLAGRRLGRGRGYFDRRFPPRAAHPPLLFGVACELQIVESVPHGSHDRTMDAIVTEVAFRWTKGIRR